MKKNKNSMVIKQESCTPSISIGVFAHFLNVHQRTLRIYDKEKLLCPNRTAKNRRLYSQDDLEKAKVILYLTRNLGINIAGVKIILNLIELQKINIDQQYKFIERFAIENGFSELQQEKNIEKHLRKGRKSKPLG